MNKQTLIDNLNGDLSNELSAIIQYTTYAAKATGPYRPQLAAFFLAEVADEQMHALFLANKIVAWVASQQHKLPRFHPLPLTKKCWKPSWLPNSRQGKITRSARLKLMNSATRDWPFN